MPERPFFGYLLYDDFGDESKSVTHGLYYDQMNNGKTIKYCSKSVRIYEVCESKIREVLITYCMCL